MGGTLDRHARDTGIEHLFDEDLFEERAGLGAKVGNGPIATDVVCG